MMRTPLWSLLSLNRLSLPSKGTDLAEVVDGGNGEVRRDSTPSQGVRVFFITTVLIVASETNVIERGSYRQQLREIK